MSEQERRGAAAILGIVSYLRKQLKAEEDAAKVALALRPGERLAIDMPDGTNVGFVTMVNGSKSVYVYDWPKLVAWLKIHYPEAVITTVDPQWWDGRKADILKKGALVSLDGEVCEEVTITEGNPYVATKLDEKAGGSEVIASLFAKKQLTFDPTKPKAIAAKATPKKRTTK